MNKPVRLHVITGGRFHDFDYARLRLLTLMAEYPQIRATCAQDYAGIDKLSQEGLAGIVLYTCDLIPSDEQITHLQRFVEEGGRIFAIHAVNAPIDFTDGPAMVASGVNIPGLVKAPTADIAPDFMALLGSRFQAHLPAQRIDIHIEDHDHPVTRGMSDFTLIDEPYMFEPIGDIHVLMSARYKGEAFGYELSDWESDHPRPQLYVKQQGKGGVLYTTLGHCCGQFDMQPYMDAAPVNPGPWEDPGFVEILRRGLAWTSGL